MVLVLRYYYFFISSLIQHMQSFTDTELLALGCIDFFFPIINSVMYDDQREINTRDRRIKNGRGISRNGEQPGRFPFGFSSRYRDDDGVIKFRLYFCQLLS